MKKKIFSILFALVLVFSFSLVTAVPVGANPGSYSTNMGKACWSVSVDFTDVEGLNWDLLEVEITHADGQATFVITPPVAFNPEAPNDNFWLAFDTDNDDVEDFQVGYNTIEPGTDMGGWPEHPTEHWFTKSNGSWYQLIPEDWTVLETNLEVFTVSIPVSYLGGSGSNYGFSVGVVKYVHMDDWNDEWGIIQWDLPTCGPWSTGALIWVPLPSEGYQLETVPLQAEVWVDDDWGSQADVDVSHPGLFWCWDAFATIQDGIDAVAGSIVNVADGRYTEVVVVDVAQITVQGESLAAIVDGGFWLQADYVTIDGLTVETGFCPPGTSLKRAILTAGAKEINATKGHTIVNNDLIGDGTDSRYAILDASDGSDDLIIATNAIHGWRIGVMLSGASSGHEITGNDIYENRKTGIELSKISNTTIEGNDIQDNTNYGICFMEAGIYGGGNVVHYNNFCGNGIGLENNSGNPLLDATNNYWCDPSGPSHSPGLGDPVSSNVLYDPWLLEPFDPEGPPPVTFDKTLPLNIGWTLVSTDNWIDAASVVGEGVVWSLNYTPSQGYFEVDPTALVPVNALYLKMEEGGGLGFDYSVGPPVASSKDLEEGWNLISSATIDNAKDILSPLRYIDVGEEQGAGLATLVSQGSFNQHSPSFCQSTVVIGDWMALGQIMLNPFDGYWVYMNDGKVFGVVPD